MEASAEANFLATDADDGKPDAPGRAGQAWRKAGRLIRDMRLTFNMLV
jgi:hypothetical protein